MATIAKKPKSAPKLKTFEKAEAVELTTSEKDRLSRALLLRWFKGKKFEKLKGFQQELISLTVAEREDLKKKIIENTKKELSKHKELTQKQIESRAEKFAEQVLNIAEGIGNIKIVMKKQEELQFDEGSFYKILNTWVSPSRKRRILQRLYKSTAFQGAFALLEKQNPDMARRVRLYMKEGDYDKMKAAIAKSSGMSKEKIDQLVTMSVYGEISYKKITGIETVDGLIAMLDKARHVGHGFVLSKAAQDIGIPSLLVMRLGKFSYRELTHQNQILQRNRHLIADKEKKSKTDTDRLAFIDALNKIVQKISAKEKGNNLEIKFRSALEKYLASKKELTYEERSQIVAKAKFKDLKILNIFTLIYADDQDREKIFGYSMSRVQKMYKAVKTIFGEHNVVKRTLKRYHYRRTKEWVSNVFSKKAGSWKLGEIVGGLDSLERRANRSVSKIDDLYKKIESYKNIDKVPRAEKHQNLLDLEMFEHDKIMKEYHLMVKRSTNIMTGQAKGLIGVGRHLEKVRKSAGADFLNKPASSLPYLSDDSLRKLFPDVTDLRKLRGTMKGGDLVRAYTEQLVNMKTMQDVTRAKFALLANTIEESVGRPFSNKWQGMLEKVHGLKQNELVRKDIAGVKELLSAKGKARRIVKYLALPAIVVGFQGYNLFTGKTKTKEALWDLGEAAAGFIPFLGTALDIRGAISGTSLSGKKLSTKEIAMYAVFAAVGAVADVATLIGGLGLGMRAGIGGMRTARRSVKIGAGAQDALHAAAYTKDLPRVQRWIAGATSKLDKLKRAEKATDALISAKAMEQARIVSKYPDLFKNADAAKNLDVTDINKLDSLIQTSRGQKVQDLIRLKKLVHETGVGIDYLRIARNYGKQIELPTNFFGRQWLKVKEKFLKMKSKLLAIGIKTETIKDYEKTFEAVNKAKKHRTSATEALQGFMKEHKGELAKRQAAFTELFDKGSTLGKSQSKYAELAGQTRGLEKKYQTEFSKFKSLQDRYETLVKKKAPKSQIDDAYKAMNDTEKAYKKTSQSKKAILNEKNSLKRTIDKTDAAWRKELDAADNNLWDLERQVMGKEHSIRHANEVLHHANTSRSLLELEMMTKASEFARRSESMSTAAGLLQKGGMVMGAVWLFSGFQYGAAEQLRGVGIVGRKAWGAGKYAGRELFLEDHSGKEYVDQFVEKRVRSIKFKKELKGKMQKAVVRGEDPAKFLARHNNELEARELGKQMGLTGKIRELIEKGKVKVKEKKESLKKKAKALKARVSGVVTGDSARKVLEKKE